MACCSYKRIKKNKIINMSRFEIKMPKLGESITEGTIISWSVKVGDTVQEDDVLVRSEYSKGQC